MEDPMSEQHDKNLRDMQIASLKKILRAATDDAKLALEHVAATARFNEDTAAAEEELARRVSYMLGRMRELQELRGAPKAPARPALPPTTVRPPTTALARHPRARPMDASLMMGVLR
jgi:hypothetical protein